MRSAKVNKCLHLGTEGVEDKGRMSKCTSTLPSSFLVPNSHHGTTRSRQEMRASPTALNCWRRLSQQGFRVPVGKEPLAF
jgi:hypothetical protein